MVRRYRSVLVTGGAGFIGSHIVDRLLSDGYEVRVLDDMSTGRFVNIRRHLGKKGFHFMKGDMTSPSVLRRALRGIEVVFHEAAQVNVQQSIVDPLLTNEVNTAGTLRLLKTSADYGVHRFIYASSSSIYGECGRRPIKEDSVPRPISPYAVSKLAGEQYCLTFDKLGKLETVCLRYFNVYGPRQRYDPYSGVLTIFLNRLRKSQAPIICGNGEQTRDFVNAHDVVQANVLAMTVEDAAGEVFNIGMGQATSIRQLARLVIEAYGERGLQPIHVSPRPGDIRHSCADIGKARRVLGYSPTMRLRDYVRKLAGRRDTKHLQGLGL